MDFKTQILNFTLRHSLLPVVAAVLVTTLLIATGSLALADNSTPDLASRIEEQQQSLDQFRQEISALDTQIQEQEKALDLQRTDLANATTLLSEAEDRYQQSLSLFNARVTAIYKIGPSRLYELILTSDGFSDALSRLYYLGLISEQDRELMDGMKTQEDQVRIMRERVDGLKQAQAGTVAVLQQRRQDLMQQLVTGQSQVDADSAELARIRQQEAGAEAQRQAQAAAFESTDFALYSGVMGPSLQVGDGPPDGLQPSGIILSGQASWYGPGFHGETTANGEIYNMYAMTAAHKTLPFGTWLKVTYNGRSVFVRINDRGPYVGGRFLDLSAGSAHAIGLTGVGSVTAEIYR